MALFLQMPSLSYARHSINMHIQSVITIGWVTYQFIKIYKAAPQTNRMEIYGILQAEEQNQCSHSLKGIIDIICLY